MSPDNTHYDSLNEQARQVNIAAKYTGGDIDKARLMVGGQYHDVVAIKGKFAAESVPKYGIFILFANIADRYLMSVNTLVVTNGTGIEKTRIFDPWKHYYSEFSEIVRREGDLAAGSYEFSNHLAGCFDGYAIYPAIESWDLEGVTITMKEIINKFFSVRDAECQLELEKTSSLALEIENIPLEQPAAQASDKKAPMEDAANSRFQEIEKQADYVVEGKVIVSPIRGRSIQSIRPGDSIKVQLVSKDDISLRVAEALKAVTEEGDILPIKGRVKVKLPLDKAGHVLYAYIAKNVLVKIIEEENVKIEMDSPQSEMEGQTSQGRLPLYVALLIGLVLFMIIVLSAIF